MDGLVAVGVPLALAIRLTSVVATLMLARHARVCRWAALGASIVASVMTAGVAAYVIASGTAIDGTLFRHAASETVLGYSVTPLSAWFLMVLGLIAVPVALYSAGYFAHAVARPRTAAVGAAFNCDGRRTRGRVRRRWRHCVPLRLGGDDPGDGGPRRDGTRVAPEPPRSVSLPRDVARRNRLSHGRFPDPGVCGRLAVVRGDAVRTCRGGTDAAWAVCAVLHRVWCEGRPHPFSRVAPRSPPGGTQQRVRLHVGGAHHGGYLRSLQSVRVWSRHAGCELGARVHVGRDTVRHSRRVVCADADRHQAPAGVQHH